MDRLVWLRSWTPSATEVRDAFSAEALAAAVRLMNKYATFPMDFPDATLVWIAEFSGTDRILTLDRRGFFHRSGFGRAAGSNCCSTFEVPRTSALATRLVPL